MAEVTWTEPALQERDAIAEYIALDNPSAASHWVKVISKTRNQSRRRLLQLRLRLHSVTPRVVGVRAKEVA